MSDQLLYQVSNEGQATAEPMIQKSVVYIIDQNNGSYSSGQVIIDTSSLSNSGKWASYSEALLQIPMVMTLSPLTGTQTNWHTTKTPFACGIKSGFWHFIHNLSVEFNNSNVIQLTPFSNFYVNYKMLTSMSQDDAEKLGASIGFFKDTSDSWTFEATASEQGHGSSNNRDMGIDMLFAQPLTGALFGTKTGALANAAEGVAYTDLKTYFFPDRTGSVTTTGNHGFYRRQKLTAFNPSDTTYTALLATNQWSTMAANYYQEATSSTNGASGSSKVWRFIASIRLKDFHDFFAQMSLCRGAYMRFIINCNVGSAVLTAAATTPSATVPAGFTMTQSSTTVTQATLPVMFASTLPGQGAHGCPKAAGTFLLAVGIQKVQPSAINSSADPTTYTHTLGAVRLYAPLYTLNPIAEAAYLEANPTKTIIYRDILNYIVTKEGDSEVNALITNGVVNPKTLIMVPIFNASENGTSFSIAPHQSVFASEPATTSPLAMINNFNVLLAGVTVFQQNEIYAWQQFTDEIQHQNAINGSQTTGLNSGLLSEYDWSQNYRYVVVDLSRRIGSENAIPKSVQVLFRNCSKLKMDYYIFLEIERSLTISLINGQLVA